LCSITTAVGEDEYHQESEGSIVRFVAIDPHFKYAVVGSWIPYFRCIPYSGWINQHDNQLYTTILVHEIRVTWYYLHLLGFCTLWRFTPASPLMMCVQIQNFTGG
jgi:hypothetical protein